MKLDVDISMVHPERHRNTEVFNTRAINRQVENNNINDYRCSSDTRSSNSSSQKKKKNSFSKKIKSLKKKSKSIRRTLNSNKRVVIGVAGMCSLFLILFFVVKGITNAKQEVTDTSAARDHIETITLDISENEVTEEEASAPVATFAGSHPEEYGFFNGYHINKPETANYISDENVTSEYAILIDLKTGNVVADKNGFDTFYPASMTKVLTLLVACEHVTDLEDTVTITKEDTDYAYSKDLAIVGFAIGEKASVKDLMYGTILPSGGDAAHALAVYVAGSEEEFAVLMNEKLDSLGLSGSTHFTNCSGYYDANHYTTPADMAMILKAAEENELCHEILQTRTYTTSSTPEHPDGISISNWFIRRIEDKDTHGVVLGAKTGFVNESGCCACSYAEDTAHHPYICVTGNTWSSWRAIYDHVQVYDDYLLSN